MKGNTSDTGMGTGTITTIQFIFAIHGAQLGMGILQIPRFLSEKAGSDAWLAVVFNGLISMLVGLIIIQIMKKNPDLPLPMLFKQYFGKWIGTLLTVIFILFFVSTAIVEILRLGLFVKVWLLPETPNYVILITHMIPAYILISGGLRLLARYSELTFYLSLGLPAIYFFSTVDGNWLYLLPFLQEGLSPVLQGSYETAYSFFGSELALIMYPMLHNKKHASLAMVAGNTLTMLAYLGVTVVCLVFFGPEDIVRFNEPTVNVLKTISFRFIERIEILVFAFYLLIGVRTWMTFLWASAYCIGNVLNRQRDTNTYILIFLSSIVVYAFFFNHTFSQNDEFQNWLGYASLPLAYLFPVLLLGYSWIFDRFRRKMG